MKKIIMSMAIVAAMFAAAACGNNQKKAAEGAEAPATECCEKAECTKAEGECCGKCTEGECCKEEACCEKDACCEKTECPECPAEVSETPAE